MPEIIDNNLLIKVLRYLWICNHLKMAVTLPNYRQTTLSVAKDILRKKEWITGHDLLTTKGKSFLEKNKLDDLLECTYTAFGYLYKQDNVKINNRIIKILKQRPKPNHKIDQQPLPPELTIMRAKLIQSEENLFNKKIAFVGDYDSTNVALSLLSKIKEVYIFDIDKRLLNFFEKIAKKEKYIINTINCDISKFKSKKFSEKFDIVVSDPPYAIGGIKKFIEFSVSLLKDDGIGFLAVPYHESISWTEQLLFEVVSLLAKKNCLIVDLKKSFYRYEGADNLNASAIKFKKMKRENTIDIDDTNKFYSYKIHNKNKPDIKL